VYFNKSFKVQVIVIDPPHNQQRLGQQQTQGLAKKLGVTHAPSTVKCSQIGFFGNNCVFNRHFTIHDKIPIKCAKQNHHMREIKQIGCQLILPRETIFFGTANCQVIILIFQRILPDIERKLNNQINSVGICN
jgi:hypothetical protein